MFTKPKRVVDKTLLATYRNKPCIINKGCFGEVAGHHLRTVGSGGGDVADNLIPLCQKHHTEIHAIGHYTFTNKYGL